LRNYLDERPEDIDLPREFEELKGSARELSKEEKERKAEEVEDMSSEEIREVFGPV